MFDERFYFRIISIFFFILYFSGVLKISKKFNMHYFVSNLVRKGDTIIDIGANLGYFTRIFARLTGSEGIVWAVEPVPLYREILRKNVSGISNIIIVPYAMGDKESVEYMGIPGNQPYRHGLTRIIKRDKEGENQFLRVEVRTPQALFGNLDKVDYIKCDIEGYEDRVIPGFLNIIKRDRPVIQIELEENTRKLINDLLLKEGYVSYIAVKKMLKETSVSRENDGDIIYVHKDKHEYISDFINNHSI